MLFHFLSSCVSSDIKVILELFKHCALIFDVTERSLQSIKKILIFLYRRTVSLADTLAPICQIERTTCLPLYLFTSPVFRAFNLTNSSENIS